MRATPFLAAGLALLATATARAQELSPDVIYYNAKVVTVNEAFDIAEAVAIEGDRIAAVGNDQEVLAHAGRATRRVDLAGKTILPGFYDNHVHVGGELMEWRGGLISPASEWLRGANEVPELLTALRSHAATVPEGDWIRGAIPREDWPNQKIPTRWQLDEAAPNHPVALTRGPHTVILNSRAFEITGIDRDTPDPPGGWIIRDESGEPSGRVLEAAKRLVDRHLP
ncbi:MAG: amidohydrolase family protein, partial [Gemmatimonadota bacterium]